MSKNSEMLDEICATPIPASIRKILRRYGKEVPKGATFKKVAALVLVSRAMTGSVAAFRELADRVDGKVE